MSTAKERADWPQIQFRIDPVLAKRLDDFCDKRLVGRALVIGRGVEMILDALDPLDTEPAAPEPGLFDDDAPIELD